MSVSREPIRAHIGSCLGVVDIIKPFIAMCTHAVCSCVSADA